MKKIKLFQILSLVGFVFLLSSNTFASDPSKELVLQPEIKWSPLNPARGDKSPQAGQLWGDRTNQGPSGFLVKFADGFSSPPHIHNVTYRGVVISGLVHNDDPKAENMWLPSGSFWTQPAGEAHITAAQGEHNIAYIEIEDGPYLVQPESEAFDNGERPVNVDQSNLVWLNASDVTWIDQADGVKMAFLWGVPTDQTLNGSFIKFPANFSGKIENNGSDFRAIIVKGQAGYKGSSLNAGSYFGAVKPETHEISSVEETVIYVRTNGTFRISKNQ
ncbi:MAG: DUF4437 domain-containing protein [Parvularculales bacterium]